jgi:two-component system LytT family response regulator
MAAAVDVKFVPVILQFHSVKLYIYKNPSESMYKCVVIDDSMIERDLLLMHLSKLKNIKIVAECADGLSALEVLKEQKVDIVFSDIDMPELTGLGLLKSLKNPPVFIFISSYSEYAVESFNLDVIDYIVKPASFERLLKAANKAIEYIELKKKNAPANQVPENNISEPFVRTIDAEEYFFIKETSGHTKLQMADVLFVESMGDFSRFHTIKGQKHVVLINLKNIEKQLPTNMFKRVHKQYIINLQHIVSVAAAEIMLTNQHTIPLSNAYKQELLETAVDNRTLKRFG